jgi:mannose-1-phosphate guanylyltransferase
MFDDCIIMAGGSGTRLWPASNSLRPKQFLSISAGPAGAAPRTFFSSALERALAVTAGDGGGELPAAGRVIIIAGKAHVRHVISACASFGQGNRERMLLIVEPEAKNTAPAIACGVWFAERVPDRIDGEKTGRLLQPRDRAMLVLTSDHIIEPAERFLGDAAAAAALARRGKLAVFGIVPSRPETGYGYIEAGEALADGADGGGRVSPAGEQAVYAARSFREKPDRALAEQYLATGRFYWNSGMFAFSSAFMLGEFRRHAPQTFSPFEGLPVPGPGAFRFEGGLRILDNWPGFAEAYSKTQAISIDYAIAEKCGAVALIPSHFSWTDIGNWEEYAMLLKDTGAEVYSAGSGGCFVDSDIPVALCGVEDLIVRVRSGKDGGPPLVFIARKGETQRVREIVEQIRAGGRAELL